MIVLSYLRTEGNGMSNIRARHIFFLGAGTIQNCKARCIQAILDVLYNKYVNWPGPEERKKIAETFYFKHQLPNCVGVIDGTLFPLAFKPQRDDYKGFHGRKHLYSLSTLIVNDHKRRVRYFLAGWPGTAHDERIMKNSKLVFENKSMFAENEFIIGDSAFTARSFIVPSFKKPTEAPIPREFELCNQHLAKARITSEHTIGMLKNKWPFLRSIRLRLRKNNYDMLVIIRYIAVAITLHNFLIDENDTGNYKIKKQKRHRRNIEELIRKKPSENNELNRHTPNGSSGDTRRTQLCNYIIENFN